MRIEDVRVGETYRHYGSTFTARYVGHNVVFGEECSVNPSCLAPIAKRYVVEYRIPKRGERYFLGGEAIREAPDRYGLCADYLVIVEELPPC